MEIESVLWMHGQTNPQMPARFPSYKLTLRAFGSGELIICNDYDLGIQSVCLVCFYDPLLGPLDEKTCYVIL